MKITQKDLIDEVALATLLSASDVKLCMDAYMVALENHLRDDDTVSLFNFGKYETSIDSESRIIEKGKKELEANSDTKYKVVAPKKKIVFTPSVKLIDRIS